MCLRPGFLFAIMLDLIFCAFDVVRCRLRRRTEHLTDYGVVDSPTHRGTFPIADGCCANAAQHCKSQVHRYS